MAKFENPDDIKVIVATDCGSTTTKAILIEYVNGEYRLISRGEAPTTVEAPFEDVTMGVLNAVAEVEELSDRKILDENGRIISPRQGDIGTVESGHSRLPVVGENRDDVQGILLVKDLLRYFADEEQRPQLTDFLRTARFIPESKRLNVLLRDFRLSRIHMAIVIDEYGGVAGLATIEDVLEQIVGEIDDEHDTEEDGHIRAEDDGRFIVKALTPIEDFNEYFGTQFSDEEFDTIGGLLMQELGRMPHRGDRVEFEGYTFEVMRADSRRVHLLGLSIPGSKPDST